jgi:hypothetical protein
MPAAAAMEARPIEPPADIPGSGEQPELPALSIELEPAAKVEAAKPKTKRKPRTRKPRVKVDAAKDSNQGKSNAA